MIPRLEYSKPFIAIKTDLTAKCDWFPLFCLNLKSSFLNYVMIYFKSKFPLDLSHNFQIKPPHSEPTHMWTGKSRQLLWCLAKEEIVWLISHAKKRRERRKADWTIACQKNRLFMFDLQKKYIKILRTSSAGISLWIISENEKLGTHCQIGSNLSIALTCRLSF